MVGFAAPAAGADWALAIVVPNNAASIKAIGANFLFIFFLI
jgi:hypothetical protein